MHERVNTGKYNKREKYFKIILCVRMLDCSDIKLHSEIHACSKRGKRYHKNMKFQVSTSFYPELLISIPSRIMMVNQKRWKKLSRLKHVLLVNTLVIFLRTGSNSPFLEDTW